MREEKLKKLIPDLDIRSCSLEDGALIFEQTDNLRKAVNMLIEAEQHMCEICTGTFPNSKECNPDNCHIGKKIKFIEDLTGIPYSEVEL